MHQKRPLESPRLKPKTVSNLDKGLVNKFQMKPQTDLWNDGASVLSSGSHHRKCASQYLIATNSPKKFSNQQNRKAYRMKLQHYQLDAGIVETQPPKPDTTNIPVASRITPTKRLPDSYMQRPPDSYMA
jgi:hypothetical protein